jgi:hypothetical protein
MTEGKEYKIEDGYIFTWCDGWPRTVHTRSGEDVFVPDYGCGWYNRGEDTPENRKKYGIPEE